MKKFLILFLIIFNVNFCFALQYKPKNKVDIYKLIKEKQVIIDWYNFSVKIHSSWELNKTDYKFLNNGKILAKRKANWLFNDILVELIKKLFRNPVINMQRFYETSNRFNVICKQFVSNDFKTISHDLIWKTNGYINYDIIKEVNFFGKKGILYNFYPLIIEYIKKYKRLPGQVTFIRDDLYYYHSKRKIYPYHKIIKFPEAITSLIIKLNGKKMKKTLLPVIAGTDERIIFGYNDLNMSQCRFRPCPFYCKNEKEALSKKWIGEYPYIVNTIKIDKNTIYISKKDAKILNLYFKSYPEVIRKNYICIVE